jgi:SAM-dependent methyltransferase
MISRKRDKCRLCDSSSLEIVVPLLPTPVAEKYSSHPDSCKTEAVIPLDLYMCQDCGHVQLLHVVDPVFLYEDFSYESSGTKSLVEHFELCAEKIIFEFAISKNALVIDIGSNDGSLLRAFQKRGMRVLGIDPAKDIAARATAAGIPTLPEFLTIQISQLIRRQYGMADIVCAFNVFAHADDLRGMTECIRELLAPTGIFVFECSYLLDILDNMLIGTIFHEHLSHHSLQPLVVFFDRLGLELIDVQRNNVQGGSIVGFVQHKGGPHKVRPSVEQLLNLEKSRGLNKPSALIEFSHKIISLAERIKRFLSAEQKTGKRFWGFGAARSGATLIAQFQLGEYIQAIVDDNPKKQGLFTAVDGIPIVPTSFLLSERPEYAIVLAWIHTEYIVSTHSEFLDAGGAFIVFFPEFKVIRKNCTDFP